MTLDHGVVSALIKNGVPIADKKVNPIYFKNFNEFESEFNAMLSGEYSQIILIELDEISLYAGLLRNLLQKIEFFEAVDIYCLVKRTNSAELKCIYKSDVLFEYICFRDFISYKSKKCFELPDLMKLKKYFSVNSLNSSEIVDSLGFEDKVGAAYLSEWLILSGFDSEGIYLVERLIGSKDSPVINEFDKRISNGENVVEIYGLNAAICWCLQKMALKIDTFRESLNITRKILNTNSLYVQLKACIPLIEIAKRAHSVLDKSEMDELKKVLLKLILNAANFRAFDEYFLHIYGGFQGFEIEDKAFILDKFTPSKEVGILHVIFGTNYFNKDKNRRTEKLLSEFVSNSMNTKAIGNAVWFMLRTVADISEDKRKIEAFNEFAPLIEVALKREFDHKIHGNISIFADTLAEEFPNKFIDWTFNVDRKYIATIEEQSSRAYVFYRPEKVLRLILLNQPIRAVDMYQMIVDAWFKGASVGNPLELFKLSETCKLSFDVVEQIKGLYASMRKSNPKLDNWD